MNRRRENNGVSWTRRRLRVVDLFSEAFASIRVSPFRSLLVMLGTVLATAALVTTAGISQTLSRQVSASFDALRATEVLVSQRANTNPRPWTQPEDLRRVRGLPGVVEAGVLGAPMRFSARRPPSGELTQLTVRAVGAGTVRIVQPRITLGRSFDEYHVRTGAPVILLSESAAEDLGVVAVGTVVSFGNREFTVIGIYDDVRRRDRLLLQALVPYGSIEPRQRNRPPAVLIETEGGAAEVVAEAAPKALHPENPAVLVASNPLSPEKFRRSIESDVLRLVLWAIVISWAVGTIAIAGAATASVYARTGEIGLRSVLGARRSHLFGQLLTETFVLGALGGLIGSMLGFVIVLVTSMVNGWAPVMDYRFVGLAVASGAVSGLIAGLLPGWRAMRLQPVDALRRS